MGDFQPFRGAGRSLAARRIIRHLTLLHHDCKRRIMDPDVAAFDPYR